MQGFITNTGVLLKYQYLNEHPNSIITTVTYIYRQNNIELVKEGIYDFETVKQVLAKVSQYEIGEWT